MKTPVLIAARNEAVTVGRLLERLPADLVEPTVIANGCTDDTAAVAQSFGAVVLEREEPGKLPALQDGVRHLAEHNRAVDQPILLTDADSWPVFPRHWAHAMVGALPDGTEASLTVGPLIYRCGAGFASNAIRSVLNHGRQLAALHGAGRQSWRGANMALRFATDSQVETYLSLPHYWPGEDHATADLIITLGGTAEPNFNPLASIYTESRYASSLVRSLARPLEVRQRISRAHYQLRGAPDSVPYIAGSSVLVSEDLVSSP